MQCKDFKWLYKPVCVYQELYQRTCRCLGSPEISHILSHSPLGAALGVIHDPAIRNVIGESKRVYLKIGDPIWSHVFKGRIVTNLVPKWARKPYLPLSVKLFSLHLMQSMKLTLKHHRGRNFYIGTLITHCGRSSNALANQITLLFNTRRHVGRSGKIG